MNFIGELIYTIPAVLIAVSLHEFAHGYVSYKLGDPTPKESGRLSLNPLKHLDPFGTLCLLFLHFGWAKPVVVDPYYYKKKKQGMMLVALAGPVMNFCIAFISLFLAGAIFNLAGSYTGGYTKFLVRFFGQSALLNIGLGVFNLIPVPPLDGSKVAAAILPESVYFKYMKYERYGYMLLMGLLFFNVLSRPLAIVRNGLINGMWGIVHLILG